MKLRVALNVLVLLVGTVVACGDDSGNPGGNALSNEEIPGSDSIRDNYQDDDNQSGPDDNDGTDPGLDPDAGTGEDNPDAGGGGSDTGGTDDSGGPVVPGVCGNGVRETEEECDGEDLFTQFCASYDYAGTGFLTCNDSCLLEAPLCDTGLCGNGTVDEGEECDGGAHRTSADCALNCRLPSTPELEPNDDLGSATLLDLVNGIERRTDALINPGDIDIYRIEVTAPSDIRAWTSDPRGACEVDTILALLDENGDELASDDDGGESPCSLIDSTEDYAAGLAQPGTYYLSVSGFYDEEDGPYAINVLITVPTCGDGAVGMGEQCEDGNDEAGDGCDASCHFEATGEEEPNNDMDNATVLDVPLNGATQYASATITTGDMDYYKLSLSASASLDVQNGDGRGGCAFDSVIRLLDAEGNELTSDDEGAGGGCSWINSVDDPEALLLGPADYYIVVEGYYEDATGPYLLQVALTESVCGDSAMGAGEECDDGNDTDADACSNACRRPAVDEEEPNQAPEASSGPYDASEGEVLVRGTLTADDQVDVFEIPLGLGDSFTTLELLPTGLSCTFGATIEVVGPDGDTVVAETSYAYYDYDDTDDDVDPCTSFDPANVAINNLSEGPHYIRITPTYDDEVGSYFLHFALRHAECGDTLREGAETCDDGDDDETDGCTSACVLDADPEDESNNSRGTAHDLGTLTSGNEVRVFGNIEDGDVDFYRIQVAAGADISAWTSNGSGSCEMDTVVELVSSGGTTITSDDDAGEVSCSLLDDTNEEMNDLAAGQYYIKVRGYSSSAAGYYVIHVLAQ